MVEKNILTDKQVAQLLSGANIGRIKIIELVDDPLNAKYRVVSERGEFTFFISPKNSRHVFEFEKDLLINEYEILKQLKRYSDDYQIPFVQFKEFNSKKTNSHFMLVSNNTKGVQLKHVKMTPDLKDKFAFELGQELASIHNVKNVLSYGYAHRPQYSNWRSCYTDMFNDILADADKVGLKIPSLRKILVFVDKNLHELDFVAEPCLVHFNLSDENIYINSEAMAITGITDFSHSFYGDFCADFARLEEYLHNESFLTGYRSIRSFSFDENIMLRIELMEVYFYIYALCNIERKGRFKTKEDKLSEKNYKKRIERIVVDQ